MQQRQLTFPGIEVDPYQGMDLKEKAALVLDQYPDARDNDMVYVFRCLWEFDGLHKAISAETYRKLLAWASRQDTNRMETWRRRRQEVQRLGDGGGVLQPSPGVIRYRKERAKQGPPRG